MVRWGLSSGADSNRPPSTGSRRTAEASPWGLPSNGCCLCFEPHGGSEMGTVVEGSGLTTGGRRPDSRKPGPDGVGWVGRGQARRAGLWPSAVTACLPRRWATLPLLPGLVPLHLDFKGMWWGGARGLAFSTRCRILAPPTSPKPPPQNSFQPPLSPSLRMPLQQLFCFSHELRLPLILCHSHHCCLTFGGGGLCCYTASICPVSFHAVDHDTAAWHSGHCKDFGRYTGPSDSSPCTFPVNLRNTRMHII